jgi:hypothetical protein
VNKTALSICLVAVVSMAAPSKQLRKALAPIAKTYKAAQYDKALTQLERAKKLAHTSEELALCAGYEGAIDSALGRADEAEVAFRALLAADPDAKLPLAVSPQVDQAFADAKQKLQHPSAAEPAPPPSQPPANATTSAPPPPAPRPPSSGLPRIAVPAVNAEHGVAQGSANLLGELLTTDISRSGKYEVLSASDIGAMIGFERQKELMGCTEDGCLAEIGNALGADYLLEASVGTIGNLRVLALKLIDVKIGKVKARESETLSDDNELVESGHRLLAKLLGLQAPKTTSGRRKAGYATLGAAGLFAAGGAALGLVSQNTVGQYRSDPANSSLGNSALTQAHFADAAFGAAVVAAGVAVFLIVSGGSGSGGSSP